MRNRLPAALAAAAIAAVLAAVPSALAFDRVPDGPPPNTPLGQCFVSTTTPLAYTCQILGYTPGDAGSASTTIRAQGNPPAPDRPIPPQGSASASDHYLDDTSAFH